MKKILAGCIGFLSLGIVGLTGCGASTLSEDEIVESLPDEFKTIYVDSEEYVLDIESFEIEKRKVEDDVDTVYCTIVLDDGHYRTTSDYVLYYMFYDVGGWLLENWETTSSYTEALTAPAQSITDNEMWKYYFDTYEFAESTFDSDTEYARCTYNVSYSSDNYDYDGTVTMCTYFQSYFGGGVWTDKRLEYDNNFDWKILGSWAAGNEDLSSGNRFGNSAVEVNIESVDQDTETLTLSATAYFRDEIDTTGGTVTADMVIDYTGTDYLAGGGMYKIVPDEDELEEMKYDVPTLSFAVDTGEYGCTVRIKPYDASVTLSGSGFVHGPIYKGYSIYSWEDPEFGYVYCEKREAANNVQNSVAGEAAVNKETVVSSTQIPSETVSEKKRLDSSDINVEDEVVVIREQYNEIVANISNSNYAEYSPQDGVTVYCEGTKLRAVTAVQNVNQSQYRRFYYYDDTGLIFAYYENDDAHRFYFYKGQLIRWRYSPNASEAQNAVNHDLDDSGEYYKWEKTVLEESNTLL